MIRFIPDDALPFTDSTALQSMMARAQAAFHQIRDGSGPGAEWLGWRRILADGQGVLVDQILAVAERIRRQADTVVCAGIGGSYLGAKAVMDALVSPFGAKKPEVLFAGHHMGALETERLVQHLQSMVDGRRREIVVIVISKSGTTLETALSFRRLLQTLGELYDGDISDRVVAVTGPSGGVLKRLADERGFKSFDIPDDVGGRFSVLTPVGLLPLSVAGVDVKAMLEGACEAFHTIESDPFDVLRFASIRSLLHDMGFAIDVVGSFEPELRSFSAWIQQLTGESEGKQGRGLFPVAAAYSTDLHSLGQIIQQGRRNVLETFITLEQPSSDIAVPVGDPMDGLGYLEGRPLFEINGIAMKGTRKAHREGGVPVLELSMRELSPAALGAFIYFYELSTAVSGYLLGINPFDQPGVEDYKKEMFRLLKS